MTFEEFKSLHEKYSLPLPQIIEDEDEYVRYIEAWNDRTEFFSWTVKKAFYTSNLTFEDYCCAKMARFNRNSYSSNGDLKWNDPDMILCVTKEREYLIPIHDGGSSGVQIRYCPWCGSDLNRNERESI